MSGSEKHPLDPFFRWVVAQRWWVLASYAVLMVPAAYYAMKVGQDNTLDRLFVQEDPRYQATKEHEKVFGAGDYVVLFAEATDPYSPEVLAALDAIEQKIDAIPKITTSSAISIYRKAKGGFDAKAQAADFKAVLTGTQLFSGQGLVGPEYLALALILDVHTPAERYEKLAEIDTALGGYLTAPAPFTAIRRVGAPYVTERLDRGTTASGYKCFPIFAGFVIVLCWILYRSVRTLGAIIACLGVNVALMMAYIGLTDGTLSMVSAVVPMTILITCTSSLVYLQSRFVDRPPDHDIEEHRIFALGNKFMACTASIFATAVGFGALVVSKIEPIREMGIWVAVGLGFTWIISFTLFPALQAILKCPTQVERKSAGQFFDRFAEVLPEFSYRWRWLLVGTSLIIPAGGAVALFGIPGYLEPMKIETNPVEYLDHDAEIYKDTARAIEFIPGLAITNLWFVGKVGSMNQPDIIAGLDGFHTALETDPLVGAVVGPMTMLRSFRYLTGKGDTIPTDEGELEELTDSLETLVNADPLLARFVEKTNMDQTQFSVITKSFVYEDQVALEAAIEAHWAAAVKKSPALAEFKMQIVGLAPLQSTMTHSLVPTLLESFLLTFVIIFVTFLLVFRSGPARLMAIIPSLFAILTMFLVMRLSGMMLNAATILIASTVLGTSENDQIHFFYHFLEKKKEGTTEALRHTVRVAMRPIFFATLINAGGFLAFVLSDLPPMKEFGALGALAFVLSMIADFTALPAALWFVYRDKPGQKAPSAPSA